MYADAVARSNVPHIRADVVDGAGDFMSEGQRPIFKLRNAGAIVPVRMTNPRRSDANQNVQRPDLWNWNLRVFKRLSDLHESDSFHSLSLVTCHSTRYHFFSGAALVSGISELNMSAPHFQLPSVCFSQTSTYLPRSFTGLPVTTSFIVTS